MDKLKRIVLQLSPDNFEAFEESLKKTNSEKFLILLRYYRSNNQSNLLELLNCNENALYVLKSRLFDKTQKYLLESHNTKQIEKTGFDHLTNYLNDYPRDTAIAMLHEIEKKYIQINDPAGLTAIYSILKKAYYHSDKHYIYSQLYNQQVAYAISLEKADDLLFSFNKNLANYYFSNSATELEILVLLKNEIKNIHALNKSHKIELKLNIILIQLLLFTTIDLPDEEPIEDLILKSESIISQYPEDTQIEQHKLIINYFKFEYYKSIQQVKKAYSYFEIINANSKKWLLQENYCLSLKFLFSKIEILARLDKKEILKAESDEYFYDHFDFYSTVSLKFYLALKKYYLGQTKEAIVLLNKIIDTSSFVNFPYMEFEIKLTLAYFYYKKRELEISGNILKNLSRKVNGSDEFSNYNHIKTFIKLITSLLSDKKTPAYIVKQTGLIEQFNFYNFSGRKILQHLQQEIDTLLVSKKV